MPRNLIAFLGKRRKVVLITLGVVVLVLIGVGDYFASGKLLEFGNHWFCNSRESRAATFDGPLAIHERCSFDQQQASLQPFTFAVQCRAAC
jgi:hypothetical protein